MTSQTKALLDQILKLSEEERDEFFDLLYANLESECELSDEELGAELNRRREEAERDPSVKIPWETVRESLRAQLDQPDES